MNSIDRAGDRRARTHWAPCPDASRRALRAGRVFTIVITLALLGLAGRVAQLQIDPPKRIVDRIDSQRSRTIVQARRGNLLDRRGRILATTRVAQRLFVDPKIIEDPNTFSERVAYTVGYDPASIERKISQSKNKRYVVIDRRVSDDRAAKLDGFALRGLAKEPYVVRDYPQGTLAGQVIGFISVDGQGLEGMERVLNPHLAGQPGAVRYLRDAKRQPVWIDRADYKAPSDGQAVRLSLDATIQTIAETQLAAACRQFAAQSGQVIVMDPVTGQVLAMANYPTFDPNDFSRSHPDDWRNRCVTDVFEPGSTFKPFVWAAATHAGLVQPDEIIDTTTSGVYRTDKGRRLHDVHAHGRITWDDVLVKSSNIGMAIVAQRMTPSQMHAALRAFGFGAVTGSEIPGEAGGIITPLKKWNHYTLTSVPMGQEIAVTALQLVRAFCALANGGYLVRPTILAPDPSSPDHRDAALIYERVLNSATAAHTRRVLRRVVTQGTGIRANSKMYAIFGKTGTAQIADPVNGGYLEDAYVSSFIGGAPEDAPRIVVACMIHRPDVSIAHHGGTVAGPAVRNIVEQSLMYLGVTPTSTTQDRSYVQVSH